MSLDQAWPPWVAGALIGVLVVLFALFLGKGFGVSSSYGSLCSVATNLSFFKKKPFNERWRLWFLVGLPIGGLISAALSGSLQPKFEIGTFETAFGNDPIVKGSVLFLGGALVGYGSRMAGGCTSGHSVLGIAQGAKASLVATICFFIAGVAVTQLVYGVLR